MPAGRPSEYHKLGGDDVVPEQARKLCLLGATDEDLADFFEVVVSTIYEWKKRFPKFSEALKMGKKAADAEVASRLYERACGYSHPEEKIFNDNGTPLVVPTTKHYPPDTAAAFIWLKNRAGWRDKQETEITQKTDARELTEAELDAEIARALAREKDEE